MSEYELDTLQGTLLRMHPWGEGKGEKRSCAKSGWSRQSRRLIISVKERSEETLTFIADEYSAVRPEKKPAGILLYCIIVTRKAWRKMLLHLQLTNVGT